MKNYTTSDFYSIRFSEAVFSAVFFFQFIIYRMFEWVGTILLKRKVTSKISTNIRIVAFSFISDLK